MQPDQLEKPCRASFADRFAPALTDPTRSTPIGVIGPHGKGAVSRYNVYRNNVTVSLIDALAAIYPAVQRITGNEFFRAMARFHVRATPPTSPLLSEYGRDFPAFIASYEYAQAIPWLADVARIERAWLDAYHAADAFPLAANALAEAPPDRLSEVVFVAHPCDAHRAIALSRCGNLRREPCGRAGHRHQVKYRGGCARHSTRRGCRSPASAAWKRDFSVQLD